MGAFAQTSQIITDEASAQSAGTALTVDELKAFADQGKYFAFVNVNAGARGWNSFANNSRPANLDKDHLYKLTSGSSDGTYNVWNFNNEILTAIKTFSASGTGFDWKIIEETSSGVQGGNQFSLKNTEDKRYNTNEGALGTNTGSYPGDWAHYLAYGPFYTVTINYNCGGTSFRDAETIVCTAGDLTINAPSVINYTVTGTTSQNLTIDGNKEVTFEYDFTPADPVVIEEGHVYRIKNVLMNAAGTAIDRYNPLYNMGATVGKKHLDGDTAIDGDQYYADNYFWVATDVTSTTFKLSSAVGTGYWGEPVAAGLNKNVPMSATAYDFTYEQSRTYEGAIALKVGDKYLAGSRGQDEQRMWLSDTQSNVIAGPQSVWFSTAFIFEDVTDRFNGFAVTTTAAGNGNLATVNLPYATTIPSGVTAYTLGTVNEGNLTLNVVAGTKLPANCPVLVKGEAAQQYLFAPVQETVAPIAGNKFAGTLVTTAQEIADEATHNSNIYVLSKNSADDIVFMHTSLTEIPANRAYIDLAAIGSSSNAAVFGISFDELTSIEGVVNGNESKEIYDIAGRRVQNTQRGLYIVNGKKVIR